MSKQSTRYRLNSLNDALAELQFKSDAVTQMQFECTNWMQFECRNKCSTEEIPTCKAANHNFLLALCL